MKRATFFAIGVLLVVAAIFFGLRWYRNLYPITQDIFERIQPGMTEVDVERLLSLPSGSRKVPEDLIPEAVARSGKAYFNNDDVTSRKASDGHFEYYDVNTGKLVGWYRKWDDGGHRLDVLFGPDGGVLGCTLYKYRPSTYRIDRY